MSNKKSSKKYLFILNNFFFFFFTTFFVVMVYFFVNLDFENSNLINNLENNSNISSNKFKVKTEIKNLSLMQVEENYEFYQSISNLIIDEYYYCTSLDKNFNINEEIYITKNNFFYDNLLENLTYIYDFGVLYIKSKDLDCDYYKVLDFHDNYFDYDDILDYISINNLSCNILELNYDFFNISENSTICG